MDDGIIGKVCLCVRQGAGEPTAEPSRHGHSRREQAPVSVTPGTPGPRPRERDTRSRVTVIAYL